MSKMATSSESVDILSQNKTLKETPDLYLYQLDVPRDGILRELHIEAHQLQVGVHFITQSRDITPDLLKLIGDLLDGAQEEPIVIAEHHILIQQIWTRLELFYHWHR